MRRKEHIGVFQLSYIRKRLIHHTENMIQAENLYIPAADLGEPNPLPDIHNNTYIHAAIAVTDNVTEEEKQYIGKGMIPTLLPYLSQDGYNREKKMQAIPIIVLENEYLRAEFMPGMGARLRRLYDKENQKELLYVNPVFQPCNLALRNAWFSGGVEFNVGIKGHNPLTCSPVFAEKRVDSQGHEYVSFYEYERIRGVVWSVNAYLSEGSKSLILRCCIENTEDKQKHMYWWSNIAVEESKKLRVIVPARESFVNYFGNDSYVLDKGAIPHMFDTDVSYPSNLQQSLDFFYKIPKEEEKWITAVDKEGYGLLQTSDSILFGRKLFLWGQGAGGRHWGEYLSEPGPNYVEIQAGLAHTQLEHFPMEGCSEISWTETYGAIQVEPEAVHGDWDEAVRAVSVFAKDMSEIRGKNTFLLEIPEKLRSRELLYAGSGWGALEQAVRGERISRYFDNWSSEAADTQDYIYLLETGRLPKADPQNPPAGYVTGAFWKEKLEAALQVPDTEKYDIYLCLGVVLYELGCKGDTLALEQCTAMWEKSLEATPNPWAARNLAAFYGNEKQDYELAAKYAKLALALKSDHKSLVIDCCQLLLRAGKLEEIPEICSTLSPEIASLGRLRLLQARALLTLNRLKEAEAIINEDFEMADIKEGELSISALWFELHAKKYEISEEEAAQRYPLPYSLDFRMH